jgi:hypothetical protein
MKRTILLILILLALPLMAQAATYWVSLRGSAGNDCTDTTIPQTTGAKRTINAGIACAQQAGDTVLIRGGGWHLQ